MKKGAACIKSLRNVSILLHTVHQSLQLLPTSGPAPHGHNVCGCLQLDSLPCPLVSWARLYEFSAQSLHFMEAFMTFQADA